MAFAAHEKILYEWFIAYRNTFYLSFMKEAQKMEMFSYDLPLND